MWGSTKNKEGCLKIAIDFTGDYVLYGMYMIKVADNWKYSCEHNLSHSSQNKQAWIGHAACAYALCLPEDIVRKAWSHLTEEQQILANKEADKAIKYWEEKQCPRKQLELMF
jgi:hypothetical protein